MNKIILLFLFLIIFNHSYQIDQEKLNKYYRYAIYFLEGMSKNGNKECANILKQEESDYKDIIEKILNQVAEGNDVAIEIFNNILDLLFLEQKCHISELFTLYLGIQINDVFEAKLREIGVALKSVLGFSVD